MSTWTPTTGQVKDCTALEITCAVSQCVCARRASARRREPQDVSDDAQRKFGDARAISSDMFFGKQDHSEVKRCTQTPLRNMSSALLRAPAGPYI